ncbi:MAG: hypothetical protein ACHQ1D_01255 [Nitrososphaerales archaeon]
MFKSLENIQEELNKTAVISDSFKDKIISMAMAVASEAYHAGEKAAKNG